MRQRELPKVLIVDVNAWREDAASNTLMEIFRCWDPKRMALVYTSSEFPNTSSCMRFFQIGENQVLKSVFKPWLNVGRRVGNTPSHNDTDARNERKLRVIAQKSGRKWIRFVREIVWKLGHWKTKALDSFIQDFNPDILFFPIFPYAYMGRLERYIMRRMNRPIVCYLADDNYSFDACLDCPDYLLRIWNRKYVRNLATKCSEMFVIVEKEKEETDALFGTDSVILTKSVDFTRKAFEEKAPNAPLRFVYTGSLMIGRGKTLSIVADCINSINREYGESKAELFIYSQTTPSDNILSKINNGASHFCGSVPRQMISRILRDSDVVLLIEALNGKEANIARLSFSTKITDYLSEGKCILAIGKEDIASIEYFRKNDAALIASSRDEVLTKVTDIINNPEIINKYGFAAFSCGKRNHEMTVMNERFIRTMLRATNDKKEDSPQNDN